MQSPLQVSFQGFEPSAELRVYIESCVADLERYHPRITQCRVAVSLPHQHHAKGPRYEVHVQVGIPGDEVVVDRPNDVSERHVDAKVAVRDAFKHAKRRIQDTLRRDRRKVKTHEEPTIGKIVRMFPADGYGFILARDGAEVYFHENAVVNGTFMELEVGDSVRYVEEQGVDGPQASTVDAAKAFA